MSEPKDSDDDQLFAAAMAGVRQLDDRDRVPQKPRSPQPGKGSRQPGGRARPRVPTLIVDGNSGHVQGVNHRRLIDLRNGKIAVEKVIDLHGKRADTAEHIVTRRIAEWAGEGIGCIRIIHGRGRHSGGQPVLREVVTHTLCAPPTVHHVLAYCPASPRDGGDGAMYVLLRKGRP